MSKKLPEWPVRKRAYNAFGNYELCMDDPAARADYWEARCRLAVDMLKELLEEYYNGGIADVLKTIGPLPPKERSE